MHWLITICLLSNLLVSATENGFFLLEFEQTIRIESDLIQEIDLCELVQNPDKYDKKLVRIKAVLVESHGFRVDGGDTHFYSPKCSGDDKALLVETHKDRQKGQPEVIKSLQKLQEKRDQYETSRVLVTATGIFEKAGKGGFGHLDWAKFRISITKIENAEKFSGK